MKPKDDSDSLMIALIILLIIYILTYPMIAANPNLLLKLIP